MKSLRLQNLLGSSKYFFKSFTAESSIASAFTMLLRKISLTPPINLYSSPLPVLGSSLLTEEPVLAAAGSISAVKAETEGQEPSVRSGEVALVSRHETVCCGPDNIFSSATQLCVQVSDVIYLDEEFPILVVRYMAKH